MEMKIVTTLLLICIQIINANILRNYFRQYGKDIIFGGNLELTDNEKKANEILMGFKNNEIIKGFENSNKFFPARNFFQVRQDIEKSNVFKFIKKMPKGVIYVDEFTELSVDWIFNATYRGKICVSDHTQYLAFDTKCTKSEKVLSDLRKDGTQAAEINSMIRDKLSAIIFNSTDTTSTLYYLHLILCYESIYRDYIYEQLETLYNEHIKYVEMYMYFHVIYRVTNESVKFIYQHPLMDTTIINETVERFRKHHHDFIGVKFIIKLFFDKSVFTYYPEMGPLDSVLHLKNQYGNLIAGVEIQYNGEDNFASQYLDNDIKIFFDSSKTNISHSKLNENIINSILSNATRITNAYNIVKNKKLLKVVQGKNIPIEISPIADQTNGLIDDLRDHPANFLFEKNYPIVVSNRPGFRGKNGFSYNLYEVFMGMMSRNSDIRVLKQLIINSIEYSSLDKKLKLQVLGYWQRDWRKFIDNFINRI